MPGKSRIIIDTDPGLDDVLAMLYAFSASAEDLEVALISLTFGNVDVQSCLKNVMSIFHIINEEQEWRERNGKPKGFETLEAAPPIVALGADNPLEDQIIMADFFHGADGLGGVHASHPHLSPPDAWRALFNLPQNPPPASDLPAGSDIAKTAGDHRLFTPSTLPAHKVMLQLLRDNPPDTFTIAAVGPLTNLALAAAEDVETFLRVKNVVVMGGTIDVPGNITPLGEFNTHADTIAFSRILSLTSPHPHTTMPIQPSSSDPTISTTTTAQNKLPPYPHPFPSNKRLRLTLCPLDITTPHLLTSPHFSTTISPSQENGSPLAEWVTAFMKHAWRKTSDEAGLALHDPLAVWVCEDLERIGWLDERVATASPGAPVGEEVEETRFERGDDNPLWVLRLAEDLRVETAGQWTRGACVVDKRGKGKAREWGTGREVAERQARGSAGSVSPTAQDEPSDRGGWIDPAKGNRVDIVARSPVWPPRPGKGQKRGEAPHDEVFAGRLMSRIFGLGQ